MSTPLVNHRAALAWDDLRLILAIAEQGSLSRAAAALGLSHPTLSRRLRDMESRLGCRLVERGPQSCQLTQAGVEMRALAARIAVDIATLERSLIGRDNDNAGTVRITAPDAVSDYILSGILARMSHDLPDITLELVVSNQPLSLAQRAADIAVRVTDKPDPTLIGRKVATVGMAAYGAHHIANDAATSAIAPWIGFDAGLACSGPGRWVEREIPPHRIRFRANTLPAAAKAVSEGAGIGLLPCFIGENLTNVARLSEPVAELETGLWLLTHSAMATLPRIRTVRAALARALTARNAVIAGRVAVRPS